MQGYKGDFDLGVDAMDNTMELSTVETKKGSQSKMESPIELDAGTQEIQELIRELTSNKNVIVDLAIRTRKPEIRMRLIEVFGDPQIMDVLFNCIQYSLEFGEKEKESERTAVLNFASAMHPGGGFLTGARAQEEAISRVSTLYYSIASKKGYVMYQENRKRGGRFYLEYMLFSPRVEFFRTSDFSFLPKPVVTSVLTVPAPNRNRFSLSETELDEVLSKRIERMLSMALDNGKKNLILGAWGCGVFGNDPYQIASAFKKALTTTFDRAFSRVTFAVLPSRRDNNYEVFKEVFGA